MDSSLMWQLNAEKQACCKKDKESLNAVSQIKQRLLTKLSTAEV